MNRNQNSEQHITDKSQQRRRRDWATVILFALLLVTAGWSYLHMIHAHREYEYSRLGLNEGRELLGDLALLRETPGSVVATPQTSESNVGVALNRRIEIAAQQHGVAGRSLVRINHGRERRIHDSDYVARSARVVLEGVSLGQFVGLTRMLLQDSGIDPPLHVASIRLSVPRSGDSVVTPEVWDIKLVLLRHVFRPVDGDSL